MNVKTVVIVNDFNYTQGGASKVAIDTARILKNENIKVYFFSAVSKDEEKINEVEYITTNQNEALKEKNKLTGCFNGIYNIRARKKFKKLLKKLDKETTVIHIHGWTKALSSSIFDIAFKMKFKVVLTLHDYFTACPNGGYFNYKQNEICHLKPLSKKCIKCNCDSRNYGFKLYRVVRQFVQNKIVKLPKKIEYVIGISNLSIDILKQTLNPDVKLEKIYNPINFDKNKEKIDWITNKYFLFVGRLSKEKGVELFCKAITKLKLNGIVVGDGNDKYRLQKEYPNIKFVGWKSSDEVKIYMKGAKCLIFPSLWYEGAPLTPLESLALGIPCLISSYCAAKEYVKEEFLFKDVESLTDKINFISDINNKKFCEDEIAQYTKNIIANNYSFKLLEFYKKIGGIYEENSIMYR